MQTTCCTNMRKSSLREIEDRQEHLQKSLASLDKSASYGLDRGRDPVSKIRRTGDG